MQKNSLMGTTRRNYHKEKLQKYLLPLSQSDNVNEMMGEWEAVYLHYAAARPGGNPDAPEGGWLPNVHYVLNKTASGNQYVSGIDCPCSHANIKRLWYICNKLTQQVVIIGCDCVKRFMHISPPTGVWTTLEKMYLREPVILTERMEKVLHDFILDKYEKKFLLDMRTRYIKKEDSLSVRQKGFLVKINNKILQQINYHHLSKTDPTFAKLPRLELQIEKVDQLLDTIFNTLTQRREKREAEKAEREKRRLKRLTAPT